MSTDLTKAGDSSKSLALPYSALTVDASVVRQVMEENNGNLQISRFSLDTVHIPTGGGQHWLLPSLEGEKSVASIDGIIVFWRDPRAAYMQTFEQTGGGTPPDCSSDDGIIGVGIPGGECKECALNQWGSSPRGGNGKACREMRTLYVLLPETILPIVVVLPPTSLKPVRDYFLRLSSNFVPYYGASTKISLEKAKSASGIVYSRAKLTFGERLSADMFQSVVQYREAVGPVLMQQPIPRKVYDNGAEVF